MPSMHTSSTPSQSETFDDLLRFTSILNEILTNGFAGSSTASGQITATSSEEDH